VLHLYMSRSIVLLCHLLLTILIAGCGGSIYQPVQRVAIMDGTLRENPTMDELLLGHDARPPHRALAIAMDPGRVWKAGESWGEPTKQQAIDLALAKCEQARRQSGPRNPCNLYSVDGIIFSSREQPSAPTTPGPSNRPPENRPQPPPSPSAKNILLTGTGFAVTDDGFILTANHLIEDANAVIVLLGNGMELEAKVVKASHIIDLALLKIDSRTPDYLPITSTQPRVASGDRVFTFGFPVVSVLGAEPKFTDGAISSLSGPGGEITFLQITVPVQPGNSGGPLVSEQGDVVGIITASAAVVPFIKASGTLPQNVNWAVNATFAVPLVPQVTTKRQMPLKRKEIIERVRKSVVLIRVLKADPG